MQTSPMTMSRGIEAEIDRLHDLTTRWLSDEGLRPPAGTADEIIREHVVGPERPDEAEVQPGHVPIWSLLAHLLGVDGDPYRVAKEYGIPPASMYAALLFYARHSVIFDARIMQHLLFFA